AGRSKPDFDMDNLSKPDQLTLLSILEGELEARDLVIEALRARRKDVFIQERYGRFNLSDPFLALQRDYEAGGGDGNRDKQPICSSPLSILEIVMAHCKKMQERMSAQLAAAEVRHRKVELEKCQLKQFEAENKKLTSQLEEERTKAKPLVMMLVRECKQLAGKVVDESQKVDEITAALDEERKKTGQLQEELAAERKKSLQMEAKMEKQLSEFDIEREQLRAKLNREENRTKDLRLEVENFKRTIEELKRAKENRATSVASGVTKDTAGVPKKPTTLTVGSQTGTLVDNAGESHTKKANVALPTKPAAMTPLSAGGTKLNLPGSAGLGKPSGDRLLSNSEDVVSTTQTKVISSGMENGPSAISASSSPGPGAGPHLVPGVPLLQSVTAGTSPPLSGTPSPCSSPGLIVQMIGLSSPTPCTPLQPGLSPRIQAARFKFQAQAVDQEKHGSAGVGSPSRDLSPTNRDNSPAKQLARNTVSHVLSRFTGPPSTLKPSLTHSPTGLKSPTGTRVDRGNPPPIPPKKPGLSQTPASPHPPLKVFADGSRSPAVGFNARIEGRTVASPSSSPSLGNRGPHEEVLPKTASPQLPPKPTVDVVSASCAVPAVATSQVGPRPPPSPGLNPTACSECSLIITTISSSTSVDLASETKRTSSSRTCDTDNLLVTASGRSPSLTPPSMSGGPVPLGARSTLLQAAAQGNVTLLSMLLNEDGIDMNHLDQDGSSALYSAAKNGYTDCVTLLLSSGAQIDAAENNGFTPLCAAAANGHVGCTKVLTTYGASINHAGEEGLTPLYLSCVNGHTECTFTLLEAGADRNTVTSDGWTPFHAAVNSDHIDCLKLLMYHQVSGDRRLVDDSEHKLGSITPECAEGSYKSRAEPMVSADLINHADKEGWTAAHIAASKGFKNCLDVLCWHSCLEPDKKDKCHRTVHDVATDDCKHLLENWNAHKVLLQISVDPSEQICSSTEHAENNIAIGSLTIRKLTTWADLSRAVTAAVTNHFRTVMDGWGAEDPALVSNTEHTTIYLTGNEFWMPGQSLTASPWSLIDWSQNSYITVFLSGVQDGCLDSVAYGSLIPLHTLQNYLRLVEQYHNVIFHGPEGSCQEHIAHQIAKSIKHKQEAAGSNCEIIEIEIDGSSSKDQLVEFFIQSGVLVPLKQASISQQVTVVLMRNLEKPASLSEFLGELLDALENRGAGNPFTFQHGDGTSDAYCFQENGFLIGTMAKLRLQSSDLVVQQHFRWVQLRWDAEPISGLLQRFLKRKMIHAFQGELPPPADPMRKAVLWVSAVWRQLNSYLSRLGTPEALMGPRDFFSCPVLPGQIQAIMKWMASLWNNVVARRAEEAILSRASVKRPPGLQPATKVLSQSQQAVVKAALSILLNKAVLHGCSLSRQELDQYLPEFQGWSFPLTMITSYKISKKKIDSSSWRRVSTGPRKKSAHSVSQTWNKLEGQREGKAH
uniref:Cortactin-binding protein 2 n=1 Tax=Callorhinchus milii TaxID=7868 RepID=A0A4W3I7D8_CALMI